MSRYLFLFLFSGEGQRRLLENFRGSAQGGINQSFAPHTIIPLPPIAEQKRIVAKVDELLAKVYAARDHLARAKRLMKRFRQSVLTAACTGRLGDLGDDRNSNGGQAWAPVYLKHLGIMKRGRSRHRPRNAPHLFGGPYPFIQTGDIANSGGRIRSHSQQYSDAGLAQSRLWPVGTVCVTIAANIADSAILTYPACFPDSVVGIIPDNSKYLPEFVELCVRTIRNDLAQFAPSTAQKNINISILDRVTIDIPPLSTQKLLVARAETLFSLADSIEARIDSASRRVEKLTQSILAKAFRGELVPTEAELARRENRSYEPASVLLDRIKSEREKVKSNGSGIKKVSPVGSGWRPSRKSRAAADTSTIGRSQSKRRS